MKPLIRALFLTFCCLVLTCVGAFMLPALAADSPLELSENNQGIFGDQSSATPPADYVPQNTYLEQSIREMADDSNKRVLLIEDKNPWDSTSNQKVLANLTEYDKVSTAQFLTVDLTKYAMVVFANDQPFSSYENYKQFKEYLETFASIGGVIIFGACDAGWANGTLVEDLPGGVRKINRYELRNYIADANHPIVTAELTDHNPLINEDLLSDYCSHVTFVESTLPPGSRVILRDNTYSQPTLVEYPLGKGRVIATGLTWEHNLAYGGTYSNKGFTRGTYAAKAMDDLFTYGIYVSSINVNDLSVLKQYMLSNNAHTIFIGDTANQLAIKNAVVRINGTEALTDENGMAVMAGPYGLNTVEATAPGYQKYKMIYDVEPRTTRYFFLKPDAGNGQPYFTMAVADNGGSNTDLMLQELYFTKDSTAMCKLQLDGEWGSKNPGKYILYQKNISVESSDGIFNFAPGQIFSPGERIKAVMVASDGTKSAAIDTGLLINSKTLSGSGTKDGYRLGKEMGFTVPTDLPIVGGTKFDVNLKFIPITFVQEGNKVKFGVGVTDAVKLKKNWSEFTKTLERVRTNQEKTDNLKDLLSAYGAKRGSFVLKDGWTPTLDVAGYGEGILDENGNITQISGYILVDAGGSYKYQQQFIVGPVPVYFEIGGGAKLNLNSGMSKILREEGSISLNTTLTLTPNFNIGGGVGIVGALTVGASGQADLPMLMDFSQDYQKVSLKGSMSLTASALFVFSAKKEILKGEWVVYERYGNRLASQSPVVNQMDLTDPLIYEPTSRDYLRQTSGWYPNQGKLRTQSAGEGPQVLQEWVLPNTIPQMTKLGNKKIMIFQGDDSSRSDLNRTVLMYSVYQDGQWSDPSPVWDNGAPDFFASLKSDGTDLYLVWQKASESLEDSGQGAAEQLTDMSGLCEIAFAQWDDAANSFVDQKYLTDNDTVDLMPALAMRNGEAYALWINNNQNNPFGTSGNNTFIMRHFMPGGGWSPATVLNVTDKPVRNMDAQLRENGFYAASAIDGDGDLNTVEDTEIHLITPNSNNRLTNDTVADSGPKFSGDVLYWYSANNLKTYNLNTGNTEFLFEGPGTVNDSFKVLENDHGKTALVWIAPLDNSGSALRSRLKTDTGWSSEIELKSYQDRLQFADGLWDNDGSWNFVLNTVSTQAEDNHSSLGFEVIQPRTETSLNAVYCSDSKRTETQQPLEAVLTNLGQQTVTSVNVRVLDEAGVNLISEQPVSCRLEPGQSETLSFQVNLPEVAQKTNYTVQVVPEAETNPLDNCQMITVGYTDASLQVDQYNLADKILLVAHISNLSDIPAHTAISVTEDSADGIVLDMKDLGMVQAGNDVIYEYAIAKSNIDFRGQAFKAYYFKLETTEPEAIVANNSVLVAVDAIDPLIFDGEPVNPISLVNVTGVDLQDAGPIHLSFGPDVDLSQSSIQLQARVSPAEAMFPAVRWESNNEDVATVDEDGLVKAAGIGEALITVTTLDGGYTDSVLIQVTSDIQTTTITGVQLLNSISVPKGTSRENLPLPSEVSVTLSNGAAVNCSVFWNNGSPEYNPNPKQSASYIFTGTLDCPVGVTNPNNLQAFATVNVVGTLPNNSVIIWSKAYSIDYLMEESHLGEINQAISQAGLKPIYFQLPGVAEVFTDVFTMAAATQDELAALPQIEYTDAQGNKTTYAAGFGEAIPAPEFNNDAAFLVGSTRCFINGTEYSMDAASYYNSGRVYIPARYTAESLGAAMIWDDANGTVTYMRDDKVIQVKIGSTTLLVNGVALTMDAAPVVLNGRTYVPISYIAQAFGAIVTESSEIVTIDF